MKAVLEFNLPEENEEFELAMNASKYFLALADINEDLRDILKYREISDRDRVIYEHMQKMVARRMEDRGITI